MSGKNKTVQAELKRDQTKCLYVNCANHAADLALQEASRAIRKICDILCLVHESTYFFLDSWKHQTVFANTNNFSMVWKIKVQIKQSCKKLTDLSLYISHGSALKQNLCLTIKKFMNEFKEFSNAILQDRDIQLTSEQKVKMRGYLKN